MYYFKDLISIKVTHELLALFIVKLQLLIVVSMMDIVIKEVPFMFLRVRSSSVVTISLETTRKVVVVELYFQTRAV